MRIILAGLAALSLAACGQDNPDGEAPGFRPPTAQAQKDFESTIGRRFNRLDKDHDALLTAIDFTKRPERLKRWDTDGDGKATPEEFAASERLRFTRADTNRDGMLTTAERDGPGWRNIPAGDNVAD